MSPNYSRTISELISISKREPKLRTILVEGDEDKRVYRYLLADHLHAGIEFLPIRLVDVSLPEIPRPGAGGGNRARVIEAALRLCEGGGKPESICCIADTDLGFILPKGPDCPGYLHYTDTTSIEVVFFTRAVLEKLLETYCARDNIDASHTIKALSPVLCELMAIRIAVTELNRNVGWIKDPPVDCSSNGELILNTAACIRRLLNKAAAADLTDRVIKRVPEILSIMRDLHPQLVIHGHDFIWLLRKYLRSLGADQKLIDEKVFFRAFSLCGNLRDFENRALFDQIIEFSK